MAANFTKSQVGKEESYHLACAPAQESAGAENPTRIVEATAKMRREMNNKLKR
jgi:hypothetical protein